MVGIVCSSDYKYYLDILCKTFPSYISKYSSPNDCICDTFNDFDKIRSKLMKCVNDKLH